MSGPPHLDPEHGQSVVILPSTSSHKSLQNVGSSEDSGLAGPPPKLSRYQTDSLEAEEIRSPIAYETLDLKVLDVFLKSRCMFQTNKNA